MSVLSRSVAALSGALLLQLSLLASGTLCGMRGMTDARSASHHMTSMLDMPRATLGVGTSGVVADAAPPSDHPAPQGCDSSGNSDGCRLPWSPGQCSAMTTCTATAAPSAAIVVQSTVMPVVPELPEPASIHSGPVAAPELPPPRA